MAVILAVAAVIATLASMGGDAFAAGSSRKPPAPAARWLQSEDLLAFIDRYRHNPEPQRLGEFIKATSRLGVLKDIDAAGVHLGFAGGVLGANPERAEALVGQMFPLPPEDQVAIIRAIAYSGLADWKTLLARFVERMPARRMLIDRYIYGKGEPLDKLGLQSGPSVLDANWGYYFATGSEAPVNRIIGALAWAREANDIEKLTVAGMAKWTLARNATRYSDLLEILKRNAATQRPEIGRELREVIEAVETYETGRLRKDAIARIDELRQKGPASRRSTAWWAQAGTTAIALGCVAASALGHVEFGLPCVIGGPLATAATKLFVPQ